MIEETPKAIFYKNALDKTSKKIYYESIREYTKDIVI